MTLSTIAGVDEVGVGPLAGPVVAAAVILPERFRAPGIKDSKLLTAQNRNIFYTIIQSKASSIGIGIVEHEEIDKINIFRASLKAMVIAVQNLSMLPQKLFIDGRNTLDLPIPQEAIIKGDTLHRHIMAASIIAKVTRDRLMDEYHLQYPLYGFKFHKGYGTKMHLDALEKFGPCPIHRRSFSPVKEHSLQIHASVLT